MKIASLIDLYDQGRWEQFLQIIETLGKDGMSSDELAEEKVTH